MSTTFDVRDRGAVGDGVSNDAAAIQAAIDACAAHGGGTVLIPSGSEEFPDVGPRENITVANCILETRPHFGAAVETADVIGFTLDNFTGASGQPESIPAVVHHS